MKPKALIIVSKREASPAFLALLPTDTQIQVVDDAMYDIFLEGFEQIAESRESTEPVELPKFDDLEDPQGPTKGDLEVLDYGPIDTEDGC